MQGLWGTFAKSAEPSSEISLSQTETDVATDTRRSRVTSAGTSWSMIPTHPQPSQRLASSYAAHAVRRRGGGRGGHRMQRGPAGAGRAGGTLQAPSALYAPPPRANPDPGRTCESLAPLSKGFARGGGTGGAIVAVERGGEVAAPHGTQRRFSGEGQLHCSDHLQGSLCGLRVLKQARRATRCARRVHAAVPFGCRAVHTLP